MADQRVYPNITTDIFTCMKEDSQKNYGTKYDYTSPNSGTATTEKWPAKIKLGFTHDPDKKILTYTEIKISGTANKWVWSGIEKAIESCRKRVEAK